MNKQLPLYILHLINDGFKAGFLLLLPFIALEMHIDLTKVGLLGSSVNMLEILFALPAAYLASKIGGLLVLTFALLAYTLGFLFAALSPNFIVIIIAFMIAGAGFALFHPIAFAEIVTLSDKITRGKNIGNFTAIGDVGRIGIASGIAFIIAYIGWRQTSLLISLLLVFVFVIYLKHIFDQKKETVSGEKKGAHISYMQLLKNRQFVLASLSFAFDTFTSTPLFIFIPFILLQRGVSPAFLGILTSTFFAGNILGKTMLGRLVDKLENTKIFILSEFLMAVFIVLLANSTFLPFVILASVALGFLQKELYRLLPR